MLLWLIYLLIAVIVIVVLLAVLVGALDFLFLIGGVGVGYPDMEEMVTHNQLQLFNILQ